MILIKVKNPKLLNCVKDYCDENLLHELETVECSYDELTRVLLQHDQAIAITDGTVFYDHVDEDFLQHIPDLDFCKQIGTGPVVVYNKNGTDTRELSASEQRMFKFLGNTKAEQTKNLLNFDKIQPRSFYYPLATSKPKFFNDSSSNYISVANGVESLERLRNVYQNVKTITYYDISITALLFTELLITSYNGNYKNFVQVFDQLGGKKWTTLDVDSEDMYAPLYDPDIMPILEHIRNNCTVNYCIGDITRPAVLESITTPTLFNLSNVFEYAHNIIRRKDKQYWEKSVQNNSNKIQILT